MERTLFLFAPGADFGGIQDSRWPEGLTWRRWREGKQALGRHAAFGPYLAMNRDAANLEVHATVLGLAAAGGSERQFPYGELVPAANWRARVRV